jgi:hypothetical protein
MRKLSKCKIQKWMHTPNPRFGGATPAEVKRGGGGRRVEYELGLLESGFDNIVAEMLGPAMGKLRRQLQNEAKKRGP